MSIDNPTEWDILAQEMMFKDEREMLVELYKTHSIGQIARLLKCGGATVHRRIGLHKIPKRPRGGSQKRGEQVFKLFHVDQRIVMFFGLTYAARMLDVSTTTLYKYKRHKAGGTTEGYNINLTGNTTSSIHDEGT